MNMNFRISPNDLGDIPRDAFKAKVTQYEEHLRKRYSEIPSDLWAYFAWNFFHDGEISKIEISPDFQTVSLDITGLNIRWYQHGYKHDADAVDFEYVDAEFRCVFRKVKFLEIETALEDPAPEPKFQYCEIDTLTEKIEEAEKLCRADEDSSARHHSMIISILDGRTVALVFRDVDVEAREPLAFDMMLHDPHYHVPLAEPPAV